MKEKILEKIYELERAKNVKVLYACESGSRAWGFPSPDSDYDARFMFVKPLRSYLSIVENDGQMGYPVDDVFDISGWDLHKTLRLIRKCNATPFEWLQSPIIYSEVYGFREELWQLCQEYFNPRTLIFHYLGIAKSALDKTDADGNLSFKKFFYVIRPILAAKWTFVNRTIPPMNINPLADLMQIDLKSLLFELIEMKASAAEGLEFKTPQVFNQYIASEIKILEESAKDMAEKTHGYKSLDAFLMKIIERHDN